MRRFGIGAAIALVVVVSVSLSAWTFAEARERDYMMVGVVVAEENVALEVDDLVAGADSVTVPYVLAPDDSWVVVHLEMDGKPGARVGLLRVEQGERAGIVVPLDEPVADESLVVALHADRGERGEFEFDMDEFKTSPDKPYFVDFEEVAVVVEAER